jgi:hypothetical protein
MANQRFVNEPQRWLGAARRKMRRLAVEANDVAAKAIMLRIAEDYKLRLDGGAFGNVIYPPRSLLRRRRALVYLEAPPNRWRRVV